MVSFATVRALALALPEAEEGTSYGTPAFKVWGKLFARLREEGDLLVVKVERGLRDALIATRPDIYLVTPHYEPSRYVLVRLATVDPDALADLIADAWAMVAPKRLAAAFAPRHPPRTTTDPAARDRGHSDRTGKPSGAGPDRSSPRRETPRAKER